MRSTPVAAIFGMRSRVTPPEASITARPSDKLHGGGHVLKAHIVEHHDIDALFQHFFQLRQRIDFAFDFHCMADILLGVADGDFDTAAMAMWLSLISTASSRP